jgi:hypothetical protein
VSGLANCTVTVVKNRAMTIEFDHLFSIMADRFQTFELWE